VGKRKKAKLSHKRKIETSRNLGLKTKGVEKSKTICLEKLCHSLNITMKKMKRLGTMARYQKEWGQVNWKGG